MKINPLFSLVSILYTIAATAVCTNMSNFLKTLFIIRIKTKTFNYQIFFACAMLSNRTLININIIISLKVIVIQVYMYEMIAIIMIIRFKFTTSTIIINIIIIKSKMYNW